MFLVVLWVFVFKSKLKKSSLFYVYKLYNFVRAELVDAAVVVVTKLLASDD